MTIPLDAIDPLAHSDRWRRSFEDHVNLIHPVLDAIVTETLPTAGVSRGGSRFDRLQITGNNEIDNMTDFLRGVEVGESGRIEPAGAAADAQTLWWWLVRFVRAVDANTTHLRPAPVLADRPNPDPNLARTAAWVAGGWLIEHATQIEQLAVYEEDIDEMFTLIRHLRGKYKVHPDPRRPRARCGVCGTVSVVVTFIDAPNGSPKPVRAGKCTKCGEVYPEQPAPVVEADRTGREVLSGECADLLHEMCESIHCECSCGHPIKEEAS